MKKCVHYTDTYGYIMYIYMYIIFYCILIPTISFVSPPAQAFHLVSVLASLVAQMVKNPPAMQETWVQSLGWEDPLEEGMATHSSSLAWRIPRDRGIWWATVHGVSKSGP